jgi:4'-phosphopantetheinyl transferase
MQKMQDMPCPPLPLAALGAAKVSDALDVFLSSDAHGCLVFAVPISGFELDDAKNIIVEAEHARAARFRHEDDRLRFVLGRAILRSLLSRMTAMKAASLAFHIGDHGKLSLPGSIRFNLSHSGQLVLVGLHKTAEIGVDVEAIRTLPDWPVLADTYLTAEERALIDGFPLQDRETAFLQAWARKEAVAKALGLGLSLNLSSFAILPSRDTWKVATAAEPLHGRVFSCFDLALDKQHVGALAVAADTTNCNAITTPFATVLNLAIL